MTLRKNLSKTALLSLALVFGFNGAVLAQEKRSNALQETMTQELLGSHGVIVDANQRVIDQIKIIYVTTKGSESVASEGGLAYDDESQRQCYIWLAQEFKEELKKEFPKWPDQALDLIQKHEEGHCQNGKITKKIANAFHWTPEMLNSFSKIIHPQMTWLEDSGRWAMKWQESVADAYMAIDFLQDNNGLKEDEKIKILKELAQWRNERWSSGEDPNSGVTIDEILSQVQSYGGIKAIHGEMVTHVIGKAVFKNFTNQHTVLRLKQKMEQGFAQEAVAEMLQIKTSDKLNKKVSWLNVLSMDTALDKNINTSLMAIDHELSTEEWAQKIPVINQWASQWLSSKDIKNTFDALNKITQDTKPSNNHGQDKPKFKI